MHLWLWPCSVTLVDLAIRTCLFGRPLLPTDGYLSLAGGLVHGIFQDIFVVFRLKWQCWPCIKCPLGNTLDPKCRKQNSFSTYHLDKNNRYETRISDNHSNFYLIYIMTQFTLIRIIPNNLSKMSGSLYAWILWLFLFSQSNILEISIIESIENKCLYD